MLDVSIIYCGYIYIYIYVETQKRQLNERIATWLSQENALKTLKRRLNGRMAKGVLDRCRRPLLLLAVRHDLLRLAKVVDLIVFVWFVVVCLCYYCLCIMLCIYIYIYIEREREMYICAI